MLKDLVYKDCKDFFRRYCTFRGAANLVTVDIEKLNRDIDFINQKLNLFIAHFQPSPKEEG